MEKEKNEQQFYALFNKIKTDAPTEWLLFLELLEICKVNNNFMTLEKELLIILDNLKIKNKNLTGLITDGLSLAHEIH